MFALRYYITSGTVAAAIAGLALGGSWAWIGIGTFPILMTLDILLPPDHKSRRVTVPVLAEIPLFLHLPLMIALWALFIDRLGEWTGGASGAMNGLQVLGMALSVGWIGAVPNLPIAHELMHRRHWFPVALSKVYGTVYLDPNRDVGHKLTHHLDLCTAADSDTPPRGQVIYSFLWTASYGAWKDGVLTSLRSLRKRDMSIFHPRNAVYVELGLIIALCTTVVVFAGWTGLAVAFSAMVLSKLLAEGFNYLQHYGMVRVPGSPIQLHHAWNHLGAVIRPLGMEITTHIDHHFDSKHRFYELAPRTDGAQMPSAFLCFACALVPPVWFATIAKPRLRHWDQTFASPAEQELAMAANRRAGWPEWVSVDATGTATHESAR
ncbi:alkane 1-monooxygenase (plasmid) [Rhodococcus pseudokoreensis]|uniref:Alkane 1-monooxygenase n=1 Tax=Rhodococcus pseudokoreensis TaxID=2811421 RepID=A0A974ZRH4_9NOCA|nr:alkane 1-monooxygenase [Rhodococcus pseudokoreensis]QSE87432.1 alkane 1-monooxygenase [Rhodococcus pseudokoreensis]